MQKESNVSPTLNKDEDNHELDDDYIIQNIDEMERSMSEHAEEDQQTINILNGLYENRQDIPVMQKPTFDEKMMSINKKEIEDILNDVQSIDNQHVRSSLERSIESINLNTSFPRKRQIKNLEQIETKKAPSKQIVNKDEKNMDKKQQPLSYTVQTEPQDLEKLPLSISLVVIVVLMLMIANTWIRK